MRKTKHGPLAIFAHRLRSLWCLGIYLPLEELGLKYDNLESDIFKPGVGEPRSIDKAEKLIHINTNCGWQTVEMHPNTTSVYWTRLMCSPQVIHSVIQGDDGEDNVGFAVLLDAVDGGDHAAEPLLSRGDHNGDLVPLPRGLGSTVRRQLRLKGENQRCVCTQEHR